MEHPPTEPVPGLPEPAAGPRGYTAIAWIIILVIVAIEMALANFAPAPPGQESAINTLLLRIQARYAVGAHALTGGGAIMYPQLQQLNLGPVDIRQRFAVMAGELAGAAEAQSVLDELDGLIDQERSRTAGSETPFELSEGDAEVQRILHEVFSSVEDAEAAAAPDDGSQPAALTLDVPDADRARLVDELGWFGSLALAPPGSGESDRAAAIAPATATFLAVISVAIAMATLGLLGLVGLIVVVVLLVLRKLSGGIGSGQGHHGLYAETFAVWLALFLMLQFAAGLFTVSRPVQFTMLVGCFFASLLALGWPVMRGLSWREVREDVGLTTGRGVFRETLIGMACYPMALPILAIGLVLSYVLITIGAATAAEGSVFAPAGGPAHPIVAELDGSLMSFLPIFVLGSIAAPIVEETMFRGVLYRHLRDVTAPLRMTASVILSGVLSGFVFAMIHPQGWMAVPALASLALAFSLAREWRGTLIAPVLMHGLSNGLVLTLLNVLVRA